jgi:TonB family protein
MSYQALLFCLDEKLARVVTQVFSELEFHVDAVNEPFAAVKKLMAQRYDAVVVDCENEPNATLLFKSARNSNSNQSSLALALVEGQTGVAKAYRIGANLVLTKPINVEQAKGTLRVARGLLRKNVDATPAGTTAPAKVMSAPAASPLKAAIQNVETNPPQVIYAPTDFEAALPAMAASTEIIDTPVAAPAPEAQTKVVAKADSSVTNALPASLFEAANSVAKPLKSHSSGPASLSGAASAPAPARETIVPADKKPAITPFMEQTEGSSPALTGSSPSFAALDSEDSGGGGSKKILLVAAAILVAAALGYFGWTKLNQTSSSSQSISAPPRPVSTPASVPAVAPSASTTASASSSSQAVIPQSGKPSANIGSTSTISASTGADPEAKEIARPAIVVKSYKAGKTQAQSEDSAPQIPSPLAVASPHDKNLSGLVSSIPTALPKPSMATLKISQGVSQGLLIRRVQPRYPQNALSMRVQGAVQMEATINKEGNISNLKVLSGDVVLARAATEAVKQWRYKPYYLNGEPVEIQTQITVNFRLPN